jgi:trans-L-3-hydroxyproline dehydratase
MHTGGEPLRVLVSGLPQIEGNTVLEKRRYFRDHYDYIRTGTMWEPRGHADMYGAIVTPSVDADVDVFFLHNEGYSTMCGHAIIALTKLLLETGVVRKGGDHPQLTINVPAGKIQAQAKVDQGQVQEVSFRNVPSFLYLRDAQVEVEGLGMIQFDIAYGGAFYAFVDATRLQRELVPAHSAQLIDYDRRVQTLMPVLPIPSSPTSVFSTARSSLGQRLNLATTAVTCASLPMESWTDRLPDRG